MVTRRKALTVLGLGAVGVYFAANSVASAAKPEPYNLDGINVNYNEAGIGPLKATYRILVPGTNSMLETQRDNYVQGFMGQDGNVSSFVYLPDSTVLWNPSHKAHTVIAVTGPEAMKKQSLEAKLGTIIGKGRRIAVLKDGLLMLRSYAIEKGGSVITATMYGNNGKALAELGEIVLGDINSPELTLPICYGKDWAFLNWNSLRDSDPRTSLNLIVYTGKGLEAKLTSEVRKALSNIIPPEEGIVSAFARKDGCPQLIGYADIFTLPIGVVPPKTTDTPRPGETPTRPGETPTRPGETPTRPGETPTPPATETPPATPTQQPPTATPPPEPTATPKAKGNEGSGQEKRGEDDGPAPGTINNPHTPSDRDGFPENPKRPENRQRPNE